MKYLAYDLRKKFDDISLLRVAKSVAFIAYDMTYELDDHNLKHRFGILL